MNTLKSLLIIISLFFVTQTNAQILKKLGRKAEKAVERTLEKNVEQKAEKETDKAFDSTFNNSSNKKKKKKTSKIPYSPMGSSKTPESTYRFSHKYVLEIGDGKRNNEITYYLNDHGDYMAFTMAQSNGMDMISVMDTKKESLFMFMDNNGTKMQMSSSFNINDITDDAVEETDYSIEATGRTKTILGYLAKEYLGKGKDMQSTIWITNDVDVEFFSGFANQQSKNKKGINNAWMKDMSGLLLEMTMTDTSKRKPSTVTMKCKVLKKQKLTIDTSEYKKMM